MPIEPARTPEDRMHNEALDSMKLEQHKDFYFAFVGDTILHDSFKRTLMLPQGTIIHRGLNDGEEVDFGSEFQKKGKLFAYIEYPWNERYRVNIDIRSTNFEKDAKSLKNNMGSMGTQNKRKPTRGGRGGQRMPNMMADMPMQQAQQMMMMNMAAQ